MYLVLAAFAVAAMLDQSWWLASMLVLTAAFYLLTAKG
jgi:hypothetical protein